MVYELFKFSQDENIDEMFDSSFSTITCFSKREVTKYLITNYVYGKVFEYDDCDWSEYHNDDDDDCEIPIPRDEFITDEFIEEI